VEAADALPTAGEEAAETKDPPLQQAASYHNQQEEIYLAAPSSLDLDRVA